MAAYTMQNGITLQDDTAAAGCAITNDTQLLLVLSCRPEFYTVASYCIEDALNQAAEQRAEYKNIDDLANHLLTYYI